MNFGTYFNGVGWPYLQKLGGEIRSRRISAGKTTLDLAKLMEAPRIVVDKLEAGDPNVAIGWYLNAVRLVDKMDGYGMGRGFAFTDVSRELVQLNHDTLEKYMDR